MDDLTRLPTQAVGLTGSSGSAWGRFPPGTIFAGRFQIVAPLGRGGMGEVYRADDLKLGQTVALKLLPDHLVRDPTRLAQVRFGLLSLLVMFYTFLTLESFPATSDFSRPYAGATAVLILAIAAVSMYGFYASRGDEPLFGRPLLD